MDDLEFDLDLNNSDQNIKNNRTDKRVQDLLEKRQVDAKIIEESKVKAEDERLEREALAKERDFFKDFSQSTSKYPGASEYQDAIKEKVMAGYSVEDATVAVMAKEGKLQNFSTPESKDSPAGGSATNALKTEGEKTIAEMTQAEKRAILEKELV